VRVFARGRGLVADEPSLVRVWRSPLAVESIGTRAQAPHADEGASFPVWPLGKGVVRNEESAGWLLAALVRRAWGLNLGSPRVLVCAPTDATTGEVESLRNALRRAGASAITVVPEPLAAAAGVGLDLASPRAQALVDVGEGVTDMAVIRQGAIECSHAQRVGCFDLRAAVADFLALSHGSLPATDVIEDLVRRADASGSETPTLRLEMGEGRGHGDGVKRTIAVDRVALLDAMDPPLERIAGVVRETWDTLLDQTRAEVSQGGLWLTGGGARLRLLVERVQRATSLVPKVPENPLHAVITGASRLAISG
jgi:rod shape-determining protein MreB